MPQPLVPPVSSRRLICMMGLALLLVLPAGCGGRSAPVDEGGHPSDAGPGDGSLSDRPVNDTRPTECSSLSVDACESEPDCQLFSDCPDCSGRPPARYCVDQGVVGEPCGDILCVDCNGLGQADCSATPGCEPLSCPGCDGPTFVGCAPEGSGPPPCAQPKCSACQGLEEAACLGADGQSMGCTAAYCEGCLPDDPIYGGCYGPDEGAPPCPAIDCAPVCRSGEDCSQGGCLSPDQTSCGACEQVEDPCTTDDQCQAEPNQVCLIVPCGCNAAKRCAPSCIAQTDSCQEGESCRKDGHCAPTPCLASSECPPSFACAPSSSTCQRQLCNVDDDCSSTDDYCVNGACFAQPGLCVSPV